MKTKKWIFTILAISVVAMGFATETPKMKITELEPEIALISFNAEAPTNFELSIKNDQNDVVYYYKSEKKQPVYRGKFNFSMLKKGTYSLCLNYGNQSLNSDLEVSNRGITSSDVVHAYKPYMTFENNRLNISHLNVSEKPVFVNIFRGNERVTSVRLGKEFSIQKCLNLVNLDKGNYEVVVTDWYKKHSFQVCM